MSRDPSQSGRRKRRRFSVWTLLAPAAFVVVVIAVITAFSHAHFHSGGSSSSTSTTTTSTTLPPAIANAKHYVVKNGDTLSSIAQRYDLSTTQLEDCNRIVDSDSVTPGTYLNVGAKCRKEVPGDSDG